jgi:hypothetical protein
MNEIKSYRQWFEQNFASFHLILNDPTLAPLPDDVRMNAELQLNALSRCTAELDRKLFNDPPGLPDSPHHTVNDLLKTLEDTQQELGKTLEKIRQHRSRV